MKRIAQFHKTAFTLAEVLITLGIIGVVAAMTMPNLIAKYQLKEGITGYKKQLTILNQASRMVVSELGYVPDCYAWLPGERPYPAMDDCIDYDSRGGCIKWGDSDSNTPRPSDYGARSSECSIYRDALLKKLKVIKTCSQAYYDNCSVAYKGSDTLKKAGDDNLSDDDLWVATAGWTSLRAENLKNAPAIVLSDGAVLLYYTSTTSVLIDVNGKRGPNKWGYDLFWAQLKGSPSKGLTYFPLNSLVESGGVSATQAVLK